MYIITLTHSQTHTHIKLYAHTCKPKHIYTEAILKYIYLAFSYILNPEKKGDKYI